MGALNRLTSLAAGLALTAFTTLSSADASAGGLTYANQFAFRYNPLGLQDEFRIGYRTKLGDAPKDDILFGKSFLWVGAVGRFSPQFAQGGVFFRTLPIAVFQLTGSIVRNAGLSDVQSVQDSSLFTDGTKEMSDEAGSIVTNGWQASIEPRLQYKKGPVAIRTTSLFRMFAFDGEEGGTFYDQSTDVVTPFNSWIWQNDADVLYADDDKQWVVGARYTNVAVFDNRDSDIQRAGPLFAYKFKEKEKGGGFANPALILISQWHIQHDKRTGDPMNQALPMTALVFNFTGVLTE